MFIIVALVYKSALSLCESLIAAFRRTGSRKTSFWMYTANQAPEKKTNGGNGEVSFRESEVLTGSSCGLQLPRSAQLRRPILAS